MHVPESTWEEIARSWLPYIEPDGERLVYRSWVSDGHSRPKHPEVYTPEGSLRPSPPRRDANGRRNERDRLESRLQMATEGRLDDLHRQAIAEGDQTPPNWFQMTVWRDGRYEASFVYSAEKEAEIFARRTEWARRKAESDREEARRQAVERPDARPEADPELVDEHYALMRNSHAKLWHEPDEPKWLERFLYTHASVGSERIWDAVEVGLVHDAASDSTSVYQRVRWEGEEEFEVLPMAEPQWVIDALEHRRVQHGENGERRRDLIVHLKRNSMRLEWGAARD